MVASKISTTPSSSEILRRLTVDEARDAPSFAAASPCKPGSAASLPVLRSAERYGRVIVTDAT